MARIGIRRRGIAPESGDGTDLERVFHEASQCLRLCVLPLPFRVWAGTGLLSAVWDALRPNVETRAFEEAADEVRRVAVRAAVALPPVRALDRAELGESQRYRLRAVLDAHHYMNPKVLVFTAALGRALRGELPGPADASGQPARRGELIERGPAAAMYPPEMVPEVPSDPAQRALLEDMREALGLPLPTSELRALALWPDYLGHVWDELRPVVPSAAFGSAVATVGKTARSVAGSLPLGVNLAAEVLGATMAEHARLLRGAELFEALIPRLVLVVAVLALDGAPAEALVASPFPARSRVTVEVAP